MTDKLAIAEEKTKKKNDFQTALDPVRNCQYTNQTVEVDGKLFADCVFTNVTFRYLGKCQVSFMRAIHRLCGCGDELHTG